MRRRPGFTRIELLVVIAYLMVASIGCGSATPAAHEPVRLFAAASTKEAAERVAADFLAETGIRVGVNPGPSPGLAKQIEQGAPADLFLSADPASADYLATKGLVGERRDLLVNSLVVVVPSDSGLQLKSLADLTNPAVRRIALADLGVPAGEYARQALAKAGVLDQLNDRIVGGTDVRATLQFVRRGEADAGIVYATDPAGDSAVRIAFAIDPALHEPVRYPLVLVRREPVREAARRFYEYLGSEKALRVFRAAGFGVAR